MNFQAIGMIASRICEGTQEHSYSISFLTPHQYMGVIIGKSGTRIREIQVTTGAKLGASASLLPNSTDRTVTIAGNTEQLRMAVLKYAQILSILGAVLAKLVYKKILG